MEQPSSASERAGWRPVQKVRAHELVLKQIEQQILDGQLGRGDRLPSERQLSELLGVSRSSVREALRVLEALEIAIARTGTGEGSGSTLAGQPTEALGTILRLHVALSNLSIDEVVEGRVMMEAWTAKIAAQRATRQQLERLKEILDAMERKDLAHVEFNALDTQFHVQIAEACGNRLVSHLMQSIRDAVQQHMVSAFSSLGPEWRKVVDGLREEHRAILSAIEQGDGDEAADHVVHHISAFYGLADAEREAPRRQVLS